MLESTKRRIAFVRIEENLNIADFDSCPSFKNDWLVYDGLGGNFKIPSRREFKLTVNSRKAEINPTEIVRVTKYPEILPGSGKVEVWSAFYYDYEFLAGGAGVIWTLFPFATYKLWETFSPSKPENKNGQAQLEKIQYSLDMKIILFRYMPQIRTLKNYYLVHRWEFKIHVTAKLQFSTAGTFWTEFTRTQLVGKRFDWKS